MSTNGVERIQHAIDDLKQAIRYAEHGDWPDFRKSVQAAIDALNDPSKTGSDFSGNGGNYGDGGNYGNYNNYGNYDGSSQRVSYTDLTSKNVPTANYNGVSAQPLTSGQQVQAKQIYDYLTQHYHLTPIEAAGILGNMQVESSFNTGAYNKNENAVGLAQWEGGRNPALFDYAASLGKSPYDWHVQVDFMMKELSSNFRDAYMHLQDAKNVSEAAAAFDQYYEISKGTSRDLRIADAESIYALFAPKTQLV
jgi:hypothetical protein